MRRIVIHIVRLAVVMTAILVCWYFFFTSSPNPRKDYELALEAIDQGDFQRANGIADNFEASQESDWTHLLRGRIYFEQNSFSKAMKEFKKIRCEGFIRTEGVMFSGLTLLRLDLLRDATAAFNFVLKEDPDRIDAHRHLASIYYNQGAEDEALFHLNQVMRLDPNDGRPHSLTGLILSQREMYKEAVEEFRKGLTKDLPSNMKVEIRLLLGEALVKSFRFEEALDAIEGIIDVRASVSRAACYTARNQFEKAHTEVDPWIEQFPKHGDLLRRKGLIFLAQNQFQDAIRWLSESVRIEPFDYRGQYQLAQAYAGSGLEKEAAEQLARSESVRTKIRELIELSKVPALDPWDPEPRQKLADLWRELGNIEMSRTWQRAADASRKK
jgi:tetratricopeptide (TPR) repeat protein